MSLKPDLRLWVNTGKSNSGGAGIPTTTDSDGSDAAMDSAGIAASTEGLTGDDVNGCAGIKWSAIKKFSENVGSRKSLLHRICSSVSESVSIFMRFTKQNMKQL